MQCWVLLMSLVLPVSKLQKCPPEQLRELTFVQATILACLELKQLHSLEQLANELRWDLVESVSKTGGHLGSNLGVVELTIALHYVYNCPDDKIVWDVSHQCYPHKILTGRRSRMPTLRQQNGLSGFQKRKESECERRASRRARARLALGDETADALASLSLKKVRRVRRGPLDDVDLGRAGHEHRQGAAAQGAQQLRRRDRRRRDHGRHGVRGDELRQLPQHAHVRRAQRQRPGLAADGHAERGRHQARGRAERVHEPAAHVEAVQRLPRRREAGERENLRAPGVGDEAEALSLSPPPRSRRSCRASSRTSTRRSTSTRAAC